MQQQPLPKPGLPPQRGLPLWHAMFALGLLILIGGGMFTSLWVYYARDKARAEARFAAQAVREKVAEAERKQAELNAALAMAGNRRGEVLAQASNATNLLGNLLQQSERARQDALALRTNALGRAVASHPDLVAGARRLYETDLGTLAPATEATSKLENVRRLEKQLLEAIGTTYIPESSMAVMPQNAALWADQELRRVTQVQNVLSALVRDSQIRVTTATVTASSPTLETAIKELSQAESVGRQQLRAAKETEAKAEALKKETDAHVRRILEEAQAKADNLLAQAAIPQEKAKAELAAIREEANTEARRIREEAQSKADKSIAELAIARERLNAELAALREKFNSDMEAERTKWNIEKDRQQEAIRVAKEQADNEIALSRERTKIAAAQGAVDRGTAIEEAEKVVLRKRASDSKVQNLLAPFLTPRNSQVRGWSYEKKPISYSQLQSRGALNQTRQGLDALAGIGSNVREPGVPSWGLVSGWHHYPDKVQMVMDAQQFLIELGAVLVEMGRLSP